MDTSAIAALSTNMSMARIQQDVGATMLRKTMDIQQASSDTLIQGMNAAPPSFGHKLDILV